MAERGEAGFSLIEALVALAVLAISAISLLAAAEAHVSRIANLESRTLARIAAENRIAELSLGQAKESEVVDMLGERLMVTATRSRTQDPDLDRIDISVTSEQSGILGGFTGFLAKALAR